MPDARTIALYNEKASEYADAFADEKPDASLQSFLDLMPKGARVLDLGCGPGRASAYMRDAGLVPDPLDASEGMIALARDRYGLDARQGTFDDIAGTAIYDGVWANFSLLHAPRADLPRYLAAIGQATKTGGTLHIGMKTGEGTHRDALSRLYTFVTVPELRGLVEGAGFTVTDVREGAESGLAGTVDPFVIMRGRKNA
ncbi:MAG: class I SAM-dependent DNA methyltransferase [Yoonia sp.]|uniref:class I SAM-dependent DNA methyltransferase n=1 Tax=Yoonia sp. TaxID=2212373 RepID=UPI003EF9AD48